MWNSYGRRWNKKLQLYTEKWNQTRQGSDNIISQVTAKKWMKAQDIYTQYCTITVFFTNIFAKVLQ